MNDLYKSFTDFSDTHFDKWFSSYNSEYLQQDLSMFSARRLMFAFLQSIIFSKSIREFLPGKFEASTKAEENIDFSFSSLNALYERNFKLYKGLSSFTDARVSYFLQPFSFWTTKELTPDEEKSREYLESLQSDTEWPSSREILSSEEIKDKFNSILSSNALKNQLLFCDINNSFNENISMFIDAVHLNNNGAKLASRLILQELVSK